MKFIQGANRDQTYLYPVSLEESIGHDNVVRAVGVFEQKLDAFMGAIFTAYNFRRWEDRFRQWSDNPADCSPYSVSESC